MGFYLALVEGTGIVIVDWILLGVVLVLGSSAQPKKLLAGVMVSLMLFAVPE